MDSTDFSLSTADDLIVLLGHRDEQIRELKKQLDQSQKQNAKWEVRLSKNADERNSLQINLDRTNKSLEANEAELEATILEYAKLGNLQLQQR